MFISRIAKIYLTIIVIIICVKRLNLSKIKYIYTIYYFIPNTAMLRLLKITLILAVALLLGSCDREKQDDTVLLEGSTWSLKASINSINGDVEFVSTVQPIEISFLKGKKYVFTSNAKSFQSSYNFTPEIGSAKFSKPLKHTSFRPEVNAYLATTLNATRYEIAGSCLKIANLTSNKFLIFERVK